MATTDKDLEKQVDVFLSALPEAMRGIDTLRTILAGPASVREAWTKSNNEKLLADLEKFINLIPHGEEGEFEQLVRARGLDPDEITHQMEEVISATDEAIKSFDEGKTVGVIESPPPSVEEKVERVKRYFHKEKPVYVFTEGIQHFRQRPGDDGWERYRVVALSYDEDGFNLPSWKGAEWWVIGVVQPWNEPDMMLLLPDEEMRFDAYAEARAQLEEKGMYICEECMGWTSDKMLKGPDPQRFVTSGITPIRGRALEGEVMENSGVASSSVSDDDVRNSVDAIYERLNKK